MIGLDHLRNCGQRNCGQRSLGRRSFALFSLLLAVLWTSTMVWGDSAAMLPMHCQGGPMPCCPNSESCARAQCVEQVPEQAETQLVCAREQQASAPAVTPKAPAAADAATAPVEELTTGLRHPSSVFRLKDDLRI